MRVVVLLSLIAAAIAVPNRSQRIVGGEPTTIEEYPFMMNMKYNWWGNQFFQACGGSLITLRSVVSAAHCYYGDAAVTWRVVVGTTFASTGGTEHTVERIINHEYYDRPSLNNDVTVLWLHNPVTPSATVAPIALAAPNYVLNVGDTIITIGWGTLTSGGSAPEQLQHVDLDVIDQTICAERYEWLKNSNPAYEAWPSITDEMLCAGVLDVGGKDACQGDSGGPVVHNNVLVGIVSWGAGCADAFFPGVNARVSALVPWIVQNGAT